jgi:hypothetical protein
MMMMTTKTNTNTKKDKQNTKGLNCWLVAMNPEITALTETVGAIRLLGDKVVKFLP